MGVFTEEDWRSIQATLTLTARELQIVREVFRNRTEIEIGDKLGISPHTVHAHLRRVYRKLDIGGRGQLLVRVMEAHVATNRGP